MRRKRRRRSSRGPLHLSFWLCSLAAVLGARSGQGQSAFRGSIDAGVARLDQPELSRVTAPTLSTDLRLDGRRLAVHAAAGAALATADRWSAQSELGASYIARPGARTPFELGAAASALRYHGAAGAASGVLLARQHLDLGDGGVWGGAGGGLLARQRGRTAPTGSIEAGAWARRDRLRGSLAIALQRARLDTLIPDAGPRRGPPPPPLVALDATTGIEWRGRRVEIAGTATVRHAPRQSPDLLGSAYATGALTIAPRVALTASAGTLAADPLRGFPARRLATLGVRWRLGADVRRSTNVALPAADVVERGGRRVLRVRAVAVTRVEVRGDFTGWQPVLLERVGDAWELPIALDRGTVHVALRLDGGAWRVPANLPSVEDEFGERSALLVVP